MQMNAEHAYTEATQERNRWEALDHHTVCDGTWHLRTADNNESVIQHRRCPGMSCVVPGSGADHKEAYDAYAAQHRLERHEPRPLLYQVLRYMEGYANLIEDDGKRLKELLTVEEVLDMKGVQW